MYVYVYTSCYCIFHYTYYTMALICCLLLPVGGVLAIPCGLATHTHTIYTIRLVAMTTTFKGWLSCK